MPYLYITMIIAGLDQWVKWLVQTRMTPYQSIDLLWNGLVSLTYAKNPGAAFSMLQSYPVLLAIIAVAVFVLVNYRIIPGYFKLEWQWRWAALWGILSTGSGLGMWWIFWRFIFGRSLMSPMPPLYVALD